MKYRLVRRARGWVVQQDLAAKFPPLAPELVTNPNVHKWEDVACWKFRWCALLHLLWLRERARK